MKNILAKYLIRFRVFRIFANNYKQEK